MAIQRAGLRAFPPGAPEWLRFARVYLGGLRRKHLPAYRGIRRRLVKDWPALESSLWAPLRKAHGRAVKRGEWRPLGAVDDFGTLCALVLESAAWWAVEERGTASTIRAAAVRLKELQAVIAMHADALVSAVREAEEVEERHSIEVYPGAWTDDLDELFEDAAKRFPRWWMANEAQRLARVHREGLRFDRPGLADLVELAHRWGDFEVNATNELAAEALRVQGGSGPESESAQVRSLFVRLEDLGQLNGSRRLGPLQWAQVGGLAMLCRIALGMRSPGAAPGVAWPWPAESPDDGSFGRARRRFLKSRNVIGQAGT